LWNAFDKCETNRIFVLQDKKQRFVDQYIRNTGKTLKSSCRIPGQNPANIAKDNPLDQARTSGKATLAVFTRPVAAGRIR